MQIFSDYYRVTLGIPFLKHLTKEIDVRFDKYGKTVSMMTSVVPPLGGGGGGDTPKYVRGGGGGVDQTEPPLIYSKRK